MMKPTNDNSRSLADLHPDLVKVWEYAEAEFTDLYPERSKVICCQTYRSGAYQNELFAKGRDAKGNIIKSKEVVTYAKGGQSPHNEFPAMAFDIAFVSGKVLDNNTENFRVFADIVLKKFKESVTWGGNFKSFKDRPHFELKNWKNL